MTSAPEEEEKTTSGRSGPPEGMGWMVSVSIVTLFGAIIAGIVWLFFYAASLNAYQNIAIAVVITLAFIAIMGATWAPWGMRHASL